MMLHETSVFQVGIQKYFVTDKSNLEAIILHVQRCHSITFSVVSLLKSLCDFFKTGGAGGKPPKPGKDCEIIQ